MAGGAIPKSLVGTKVSGSDKSTVTISGCAVPRPKKTYASASGKAASLRGTITGSSSKKTTVLSSRSPAVGLRRGRPHRKGDRLGDRWYRHEGGDLQGSSGFADRCVNVSSGAISLKPGMKADIRKSAIQRRRFDGRTAGAPPPGRGTCAFGGTDPARMAPPDT